MKEDHDNPVRGGTISLKGDEHACRGFQAFDTGNSRLATEEFQQALQTGTITYDESRVWLFLGLSFNNLGDRDRAVEAFQSAIQHNEQCFQSWNNLGLTYADTGRFEQAIDCYERSVVINPEYSYAYANMGIAFIHCNQPEKAVSFLEKAITLHCGLAVSHANLALAYGMLSRFTEAYDELKLAIALGYKAWKDKKRRIDNLKAFEQTRSSLKGE